MFPTYNKVKGIHPGAILKRELKKRNIKMSQLAQEIGEYPQTLNAIIKEKRGITASLSIKLGEYFNIEKEYFALVQAVFNVSKKLALKESNKNPLIHKIRKSLFWDTDINKLDLANHKNFIITRILERGNEEEISELINIYSIEKIKSEIRKNRNSFYPNYRENIEKYIFQKQ